ncbi:helix-turn-helix domain-containing protein [Listeria goaensis]|uniref:helix-turn-helix domain-containing protein n=1 Tax=Listeria goaensis TaxID=1649188 RepID=UPI00135664C9|nr:helix-turn-helix transcriptional regulator [Listeria goaensis]
MSQNIHNLDGLGDTIRKIRENKQLTQKEVAGDIPRATYSRIEAGKTIPSLENFFQIVNRLFMEVGDFMMIHEDFKVSERRKILQLFKNVQSTLNEEGFHSFFEFSSEYLKTHHDLEIENLFKSLQGLYQFSKTDDRAETFLYVKPLWLSLKNKDELYYWDSLALSSIIFSLPDSSDIHFQVNRLANSFKRLAPFYPDTQGHLARLYLNAVFGLKENNHLHEGGQYVDAALEISEKLPNRDRVLYYDAMYRKAEIEFVTGNEALGRRLATESFQGLQNHEVTKGKNSILNDNMSDWQILIQKKS